MTDDTSIPEPDPTPGPTASQAAQAGALVKAAARRLEEQGLIDRDDNGTASLTSDAIRQLFDLIVLWNIHTQDPGDELPDTWRLGHDAGVVLQQAMVAILFAPEQPDAARQAYRQAVTYLRHAARNHRY